MTDAHRPFRWTSLLLWAGATALGWLLAHPLLQRYVLEAAWLVAVIGIPVVAVVTFILTLFGRRRRTHAGWSVIAINIGWTLIVVFSLILCRAGSIAGVLQWLVLRRHISRGAGWMIASAAGAFAAINVSRVFAASETFYVALEGAVLGILQWLVLRGQVKSPVWWIPASTIGWVMGGLAIGPAWTVWDPATYRVSEHAALLAYHTVPSGFGGLVCGGVTGASLWALLKNRRRFGIDA
jgi:hypothetical protein